MNCPDCNAPMILRQNGYYCYKYQDGSFFGCKYEGYCDYQARMQALTAIKKEIEPISKEEIKKIIDSFVQVGGIIGDCDIDRLATALYERMKGKKQMKPKSII